MGAAPTPQAALLEALKETLRAHELGVFMSGRGLDKARAALAQAEAAQPVEPLTRFCPGCGSVGPVPAEFRDCCPDGGHARMAPESLAQRCHDLFQLALRAPSEPDEVLAAPQPAEAAPKQEAVAGWQIVDKNGIHVSFIPRTQEFFGSTQDNDAPDAEKLSRLDRDWPGLAPHRVVPLAAQPQQPAPEPVALPKEPPPGLLMSMAIRYDHALGMPGYYDSELLRGMSGVTHAQRLESTLRTMRQLYEEVSGHGFYRPEREAEYTTLAAAPQTPAFTGDVDTEGRA